MPFLPKIEFPPANMAQWISAITSFVATIVAVWAFFFSSASGVIVEYLESELKLRNNQIVALESREKELTQTISSRETYLAALEVDKSRLSSEYTNIVDAVKALDARVAWLGKEREKLELRNAELSEYNKKMESALHSMRFEIVKAKMYAMIKGVMISDLSLILFEEAKNGTKPRKEDIFKPHLAYVASLPWKLSEEERMVASEIVALFSDKCSRLSSNRIYIPQMRAPNTHDELALISFSGNKAEQNNSKAIEYQNKMGEVQERIAESKAAIRNCFLGIER